jgi:hypothetical protein
MKSIKPLKGLKSTKPFHTPNSPKATVNLDGSGVRQKVGKKVSSYMDIPAKAEKSYGPKKQTLA